MAERGRPFNPITSPRSTTFKALKPIEGIVIVYTFHDSNYLGPAGPTGNGAARPQETTPRPDELPGTYKRALVCPRINKLLVQCKR
jgi:hypothetical protein